ncbi:hypothetical protein LD13_gp043 [Bacillus phage Bobb]|uniref:Uncharacterized protein n=1 Tax=Bacillus phage Bobb TaxID=1527469 RepID=A0A076G7M1_9CAUD|nr:hypothetical protein LD13_gp043 [Bacillus phage Bobb]AII27944.1 hypothetical protein [Bacillus phage Bobb]
MEIVLQYTTDMQQADSFPIRVKLGPAIPGATLKMITTSRKRIVAISDNRKEVHFKLEDYNTEVTVPANRLEVVLPANLSVIVAADMLPFLSEEDIDLAVQTMSKESLTRTIIKLVSRDSWRKEHVQYLRAKVRAKQEVLDRIYSILDSSEAAGEGTYSEDN